LRRCRFVAAGRALSANAGLNDAAGFVQSVLASMRTSFVPRFAAAAAIVLAGTARQRNREGEIEK